jgi:hypothetical protein
MSVLSHPTRTERGVRINTPEKQEAAGRECGFPMRCEDVNGIGNIEKLQRAGKNRLNIFIAL